MDLIENLFSLVSEALKDIENNNPLSSIIRKAIRIAKLKNDFGNLFWLEYEMISFDDTTKLFKVSDELKPHFQDEDFKIVMQNSIDTFIADRKMYEIEKEGKILKHSKKENTCSMSIEDIENRIEGFKKEIINSTTPDGLHPVDKYFVEKDYSQARSFLNASITDYQSMLCRIKQRIFKYLSDAEKELYFAKVNSDIFEKNRQYIDEQLKKISPGVFDQFQAAYKRLSENEPEARNQAITTCRRILKAVSDIVYPANNKTIIGKDGQERKLTDEKYINRLWQFLIENIGETKSGALSLSQLKGLGDRFEKIYDLSSKGVHTEISDFEVNQCVIQTYLLIGDILRIYNKES
jgi:hypothetical protein